MQESRLDKSPETPPLEIVETDIEKSQLLSRTIRMLGPAAVVTAAFIAQKFHPHKS